MKVSECVCVCVCVLGALQVPLVSVILLAWKRYKAATKTTKGGVKPTICSQLLEMEHTAWGWLGYTVQTVVRRLSFAFVWCDGV